MYILTAQLTDLQCNNKQYLDVTIPNFDLFSERPRLQKFTFHN